MYQQLKDRYIGDGEWIQICREDLNICSQTANRYISFYELVSAYPRIVITGLTFETIMYCKAEILEELARDFELSMRFKMPLREVSIHAAMNIGEAGRLASMSQQLMVMLVPIPTGMLVGNFRTWCLQTSMSITRPSV